MTSTLTVYVPTHFEGTVFEEIATINGNTVPCRYHPRDLNRQATRSNATASAGRVSDLPASVRESRDHDIVE